MRKKLKLVKEIEQEGDNVVEFQTVTGGKGPTDYHPNDWLSPLKDGTVFLFFSKQRPNEPNLGQGKILNRTDKAIYLGFVINGQPMQGPVDPLRFCNAYGMFENLGVMTYADDDNDQREEEEIIDEQSQRDSERNRLPDEPTDPSGDVAGIASLSRVPEGTPPSGG